MIEKEGAKIKRVNIRFGKVNSNALEWMWEVRRKELNDFDSRRKLTFNEFINEVVNRWLKGGDEEIDELRDRYWEFVREEELKKGKGNEVGEKEDW